MHKILFILLLVFIGCSGGGDDEAPTSSCSGVVDGCGVCNGYNQTMDCDGVCDGTNILTDGCDLPDLATTAYVALGNDGTIYFNSPQEIAGFEFIIDGISADVDLSMYGGQAGATNGFDNLNCNHNDNGAFCMGFNFTGSNVSAGCGTLINISAGTCSGADTDADGTPDTTQPTNKTSCSDPAGDQTGTAGTWTSAPFTTLSSVVVSGTTAGAIYTEIRCNY